MGKKSGGSAPKIDPRIGEAMEKMANTMEQQQDWYQNDLYPWMQAQAIKQNQAAEEDRRVAYQNYNFWQDFATKQYDEQKELADFYFNRYLNDLKPVEDSLIADANKYNTSAEAERQAGYAIADMATSQAGQRQAANMQMQQYGINPTAGAYQAQNRAQDIQNAAIRGAAANQARQAAEALGWQKKAQVASLGQNYINNSNTATQLAYTGTQLGANNANQALGQASALGQVGLNNIATVGNTGYSFGNHLHFEMTQSGYRRDIREFFDRSTIRYNPA